MTRWARSTLNVRARSPEEVAADIDVAGYRGTVSYRGPAGGLDNSNDVFVPSAFLLAMRVGGTLELSGPVSQRLLAGLDAIQEVILTWDRQIWSSGLRRVELRGPSRTPEGAAGRGVGCFFSAGVDGSYSALKHQSRITHLIFVHGFDVLETGPLDHAVTMAVRKAAADLGKPLVELYTNVRAYSDPILRWELFHGAALASAALALTPMLETVYVPASASYATLAPWGSHPLIDPLWSTERVAVVHDGAERTRLEKLAVLAGEPAALRWLRVCWENPDDAYNCGRCSKCLVTMVCLRALGVLDSCATFPALDLEAVASAQPLSRRLFSCEQVLRGLEESGHDEPLAQAVRCLLRTHRRRLEEEWNAADQE